MRYKPARAASGSTSAKRPRPRPYLLQPTDAVTARSTESWLCLLTDEPDRVAPSALTWTSRVSIEPPDALLLEVGGSRRLFGDLERLHDEIARTFMAQGWSLRLALAPTPQAALWLARGAPGTWVESWSLLPGPLGALPLQALDLAPKWLERLQGFGLRRLRDVARLPRAALARRIGPAFSEMLARALGEQPDPRCDWQPPPRFSATREFEFDVTSTALLRSALTPLFADLVGVLRAGNRSVRRCTVVFHHRGAPATRMRIGVLDPVCDASRLEQQLWLLIEKTPLPAPALAVSLHAARLERVAEVSCDLFAPRNAGDDWHALFERLRARLGERSLFGLGIEDDHRPERAATRIAELRMPMPMQYGATQPVVAVRRPLWLLPAPHQVEYAHYHIESGPERIESGWWDGADTMRDYFVARDDSGTRSWIFRDRAAPHCWFLHGLFG